MSAVSSWLLAITGVILLSVLAEFVLPEGQINKYIKVIFSFVILLCVIMPLPKLIGKDFEFKNFFQSEIDIQDDYLYQLNIDKLTSLQTDISDKVKEAGLMNVTISINADVLSKELEIYSIHVDLRDLRFDEKFGSTDKSKAKEFIIEVIGEFSILKNVEVKFNE